VWEAIFEAGQAHGIVAYGTETMHVLRAEKATSSWAKTPTAR
jgi:sarcosine oxidase subunit alpha